MMAKGKGKKETEVVQIPIGKKKFPLKIESTRREIAMYSKLRITFCSMPEADKGIFNFLTKKKYTFSKSNLPAVKLLKMYLYSVNVDSLEEAVKLKKKIEKLNK